LTAKKAGGLCLMSTEVSEDAVINLADWVAEEFAYGFANFEDTIGFTGTGSQAHLGVNGLTNIFVESASLAGGVLAAAGHDTFAEIDATDLATLMGKLPEYATPNAKFYTSRTGAELVFGRLQSAAGGNTIGTLSGDRVGRSYLGYPIVVSQVLPANTTAFTDGNPMLFFGDLMKSSTMGDRRQVSVFPSEHRYMDTDQIGIRGTERIDIVNHDVGNTTTAGPIVALLANAS
jgi:HK97 family phage major capsid protein